eukprot:c19071_g1_i1 orf=163-1491(-)
MSPFKNCVLSSHQILYKSLYLNPLSDSAEHPLSHTTATSSFYPTSSSSISSSSVSLPSLESSSRNLRDQAEESSLALQSLMKENDPPQKQGQSSSEESIKHAKERVRPTTIGQARRREPLQPVVGGPPKRELKCETGGIKLQDEEDILNVDGEAEEKAPLFPPPTPTLFSHMWDDPECEVAPASSWSTLGNRTLLCRPLPLDVGRCVCYIKRERHNGIHGYVLYTDEGHGRQDRKLAVAVHKRRAGKSEFVVHSARIDSIAKSEAELGKVRANLLGSRYSIWDGLDTTTSRNSSSPALLGVVIFEPTVSSLTGTYRVMRASIPKYQSMQITPFTHREKNGLAPDWEEHATNVHTLCSCKPLYNKVTRCYELDFRDRAKRACKIKTSAKNMLLTMNENGKQAILMFGKLGKSKYLMEYRFPLTAYQAFSICLSSLDSKLCCTL